MANLVRWIQEELVNGEIIEGVVIGKSPRREWESGYLGRGKHWTGDNIFKYKQQPHGKLISWDEAKKWLDYDFNHRAITPECNMIYVWTNRRVFFLDIGDEDGFVFLTSVPRNPQDILP